MILRLKTMQRALLASAALAAPIGAYAQSATQAPVQQADTTEGVDGSNDIIVTAQRRAESLQKSSLSIAVLQPATLDRASVSSPADLNAVVPGLKIAVITNNAQLFIRGVGDISGNMWADPGVATNLDGVYVARSSAIVARLYDLERIEVLKGPQGTLYGRNASGGALNIITAKPKLGETSGRIAAEIGNYDKRYLDASLNVPVSDTVAVRFSGQIVRRDGYLTDGHEEENHESGRLRVLWQPSDDITNIFTASASHVGGAGGARVFYPFIDRNNPWIGPTDPRVNTSVPGFATLTNRTPVTNRIKLLEISNEFNWNIGGGDVTLTVLPAYQRVNAVTGSHGDLRFLQTEFSEQKSGEVRLSQNNSSIRWVLGAYLFNDDARSNFSSDSRKLNPTLTGRFASYTVPRYDTRARAVFGEANYSLTPTLRAIGGIRYTSEKKILVNSSGAVSQTYLGLNTLVSTVVSPAPYTSRIKGNKVTWKVGAEFDIAPRNMIYVTYATGYKAGGLSGTEIDPHGPENIKALQGGSRNEFFGGMLRLNLESFLYKYRGQQVTFLNINSLGNSALVTSNIGRSTIWGGAVDVNFRPTPADTLSFNVEYLNSNQDEFTFTTTAAAVPAGQVAQPSGCLSLGSPAPGRLTVDCAGFPLQRSPKWSGFVRYQHVFELAGGATITPGVQTNFSSSYWLGVLGYGVAANKQDSYALVDADLTFETASKGLSLAAFIRNIGDKPVFNAASLSGQSRPGGVVANIQAPRTYGVRAIYKF